MIQLNKELQAALDQQGESVEVIDPRNDIRYVLIRADALDRIRQPAREDEAESLASTQMIRVAGRLGVDPSRGADGAFAMDLDDGHSIAGLAKGIDPGELSKLQGQTVVVSGRAFFDPSNALLRVEATRVVPASPVDLAVWSEIPRASGSRLDMQSLRRPQTPTTGFNAILGQWPGDETDEEVEAYLEEIS